MGLYSNGNDFMYSGATFSRAATDHSISIWLRLDDSSSVRRPFGHTGSWEMRTSGTNLVSDLLQSGTLTEGPLTIGTYHHVVDCVDVTNTDRFMYIDGVLVDSVASASFAGAQSSVYMMIGSSYGNYSEAWYGAVDDFRIYERVLTQEEAQTIYTCRGTDGIIDDLSHWWPMDEGSEGSTISLLYDIVGGYNLDIIYNDPIYNYDAGIKRRRYV